MSIMRSRKGELVLWEPTTELICSRCRQALPPTLQTIGEINFVFEFADPDPLTRGEYFYLHKKCSWIENALEVSWGMHEMKYVLGKDVLAKKLYGDLQKYLRTTMPAGVYDQLYEQWFSAGAKIEGPKTPTPRALRQIPRIPPPVIGVYIARAEGTRRIKIGRSTDVFYRHRGLHTASPFPITLLRVLETKEPDALEAYLHRRYASHRVYREWFELPEEELRQLLTTEDPFTL